MLNPYETPVFLPTFVLQFVNNDSNDSHLDPLLFLKHASSAQILEIISLLYPHIRFSPQAKEDPELVQKIFVELVAPHFSRLTVPTALKADTTYFQASVDSPISRIQDYAMLVTPGMDVNSKRIFDFDCQVLRYLKIGQHRLAADNLIGFTQAYKYLNEHEMSNIEAIYDEAMEGLDESVRCIQQSHSDIEGIHFLLSESEIPNLQELHLCLESATAKLKSREKTFESIVQSIGFIRALKVYHRKIALKHQATPAQMS